jgi:hypothetical protein
MYCTLLHLVDTWDQMKLFMSELILGHAILGHVRLCLVLAEWMFEIVFIFG